MAIKKYKPVTPGQRNKAISSFEEITAKKPYKKLLEPLKSSGGRNNTGQMTVRYRGGGHKRMYRIIDFVRNRDEFKATVLTIEYDPNRSARIALIQYEDGLKSYILAPNGLQVGQTVESGEKAAPELGNCLPLSAIPVGTLVHAIELRPGQGAAMARSAGTFAQLAAREGNHAILRLPSGETRMVLCECRATVGIVSNTDCRDCSGSPAKAERDILRVYYSLKAKTFSWDARRTSLLSRVSRGAKAPPGRSYPSLSESRRAKPAPA